MRLMKQFLFHAIQLKYNYSYFTFGKIQVSEGRFYIVKDTTSSATDNNITITPNGSNTIDLSTNSQVIRNNLELCVLFQMELATGFFHSQ